MTAMPRRVFALGTVGAVAAFTLSACGSSDSADSSSAAGGGSTSETETSATSEETAEESDVAAGNDAGKHTIVFEVTSDTATTADITLTSLDANGNISQEQLSDEALPFSKTVEIDGAVVFDASNANVLAQAKDGTDITASIAIDDNEPVSSSGSGEFATAISQATN
ncbi:hypothetical protein [Actinomyces glycerinitolerans]|uniref:Uncharacterized protein n=1 Tax=Actinomyces glycerinitolerans TaxID=1892869 RepID=A0A1M4RZM6_9ACTO|nr:hypothetical protein [Actinomyces glycerinitolerans]SHE25436.1 Hypothetical protein ACGLYG10_1652 [Actinomyces glycerinitolerans]